MSQIPIYDETAPIVRTAASDEISKRIGQIETMRAHMDRLERTPDGLLLHFTARPDMDAELRQFTVDEKGCCQFWGFEVTTSLATTSPCGGKARRTQPSSWTGSTPSSTGTNPSPKQAASSEQTATARSPAPFVCGVGQAGRPLRGRKRDVRRPVLGPVRARGDLLRSVGRG